MVRYNVSVHPLGFILTHVMMYVPGVVQEWRGFLVVVFGEPSPKSHQLKMPELVLLKVTTWFGATGDGGLNVAAAVGEGWMLITIGVVVVWDGLPLSVPVR
jgi:hypothetical protein